MRNFLYSLLLMAIVAQGFNYRLYQQRGLVAKASVNNTGKAVLNGSGSYDPNAGGRITKYVWVKVSGPSVTMQAADSVYCPLTGLRVGVYKFRLTVTDSEGRQASAVTQVTVIR